MSDFPFVFTNHQPLSTKQPMSNEIKAKYGASTPLSITLANLASSAAGVGRQSALIDNSSNRFGLVHLFVKVTLGTNPASNKTVQVYLLQGDGGGLQTDGAGAADAPLTIKNAPLLGVLSTGGSAASSDVLQKQFNVHEPGPQWAIAIVHDTGTPLSATAANHAVHYLGDDPEVQ
jgi:hypothetical protein